MPSIRRHTGADEAVLVERLRHEGATGDVLLKILKMQRMSSVRFLEHLEADPAQFDCLRMLQATQALIDELDRTIQGWWAIQA